LEGKTGKLGGKPQGRNDRNENAHAFSEKNRKKKSRKKHTYRSRSDSELLIEIIKDEYTKWKRVHWNAMAGNRMK
jgi:ribonuclease HI